MMGWIQMREMIGNYHNISINHCPRMSKNKKHQLFKSYMSSGIDSGHFSAIYKDHE